MWQKSQGSHIIVWVHICEAGAEQRFLFSKLRRELRIFEVVEALRGEDSQSGVAVAHERSERIYAGERRSGPVGGIRRRSDTSWPDKSREW